ncbi:MAG: hypothetical protein KDK64_01905 [Chlamydiia bacterium]|nr:hypothetical protein [Chlamydiia bacterium]
MSGSVDGLARSVVSSAPLTHTGGGSSLTFEKEKVRPGPTNVTSLLTAELGGATLEATVRNPGVSVEATVAYNPLEVDDLEEPEALIFEAPQAREFDPENIDQYLNGRKAVLVFSTAAGHGEGVKCAKDLNKEVDGKPVPDDDRQQKVNVQFAKLKHLIGVAGRHPRPNKPISYSTTWHFVEVYDRPGATPKKYDLTNKDDIRRLLEDEDVNDVTDEKVDKIYQEALSINREVKKLTEPETGKRPDAFLHDYVGNPNGLELYSPFTRADQKVKTDSKHAKYGETLVEFGLAQKGSRIFGSNKLTAQGAKAFNNMEKVAYLQKLMLGNLSHKIGEKGREIQELQQRDETEDNLAAIQKLKGERDALIKAYNEIKGANETAMHFVLMELEKPRIYTERRWNEAAGRFETAQGVVAGKALLERAEDTPQGRQTYLGPTRQGDSEALEQVTRDRRFTLASDTARDYEHIVSRENKHWTWKGRKPYETSKEDKQQAVEVGTLMYHLAQDADPSRGGSTERVELIQANQRLNRETFKETTRDASGNPIQVPVTVGHQVFREPKGERLLLHAVLYHEGASDSGEALGSYGSAPEPVRETLLEALDTFKLARDSAPLNAHKAGESVETAKVGQQGREAAPAA